jgi:hypothetical protein
VHTLQLRTRGIVFWTFGSVHPSTISAAARPCAGTMRASRPRLCTLREDLPSQRQARRGACAPAASRPARPHVEEGDAPEADDRHPVGIDRPSGTYRQEVVPHAEDAGGEEEGDGVVTVPPFGYGILHAGEQRGSRLSLGRTYGLRQSAPCGLLKKCHQTRAQPQC